MSTTPAPRPGLVGANVELDFSESELGEMDAEIVGKEGTRRRRRSMVRVPVDEVPRETSTPNGEPRSEMDSLVEQAFGGGSGPAGPEGPVEGPVHLRQGELQQGIEPFSTMPVPPRRPPKPAAVNALMRAATSQPNQIAEGTKTPAPDLAERKSNVKALLSAVVTSVEVEPDTTPIPTLQAVPPPSPPEEAEEPAVAAAAKDDEELDGAELEEKEPEPPPRKRMAVTQPTMPAYQGLVPGAPPPPPADAVKGSLPATAPAPASPPLAPASPPPAPGVAPPPPPAPSAAPPPPAPSAAPPPPAPSAAPPPAPTSPLAGAPPPPPSPTLSADARPRPRRRRREKQWFEEVFDEDFLRTQPRREPEQLEREVDFLAAAITRGNNDALLDVGCGQGQQAIELARRGYTVTGFDLSLPLLIRAAETARKTGVNVNFVHGDMREMSFDSEFDGAYAVGSTFGFFDDDANRHILSSLAKALRPGGRLLLDLPNRDYLVRELPTRVWWEGEGCMVLEEVDFNYFASRLTVQRTVVFEDGRQLEQEISIRAYSLHEIGKLLHHCGFKVIEVSGQMAMRGHFFGADSRSLLVIAEKRPPSAP